MRSGRADFNNDAVDAGDIGAGASVTALYEIVQVGSDARLIDDSRYETQAAPPAALSDEFGFLKLRYKAPGEDDSVLMTRPVTPADAAASLDASPEAARFAAAVAGYGQMLRGDPYLADGYGWDEVFTLAQGARGDDPFGYRAEFVQLVRAAKSAAAQAALEPPGSAGD